MPRLPFLAVIAAGSLLAAGCAHRAPARAADISSGARLFAQDCAACHGDRGTGGPIGPALTTAHRRLSADQLLQAIENPVPPMPKLYPGTLDDAQVRDLAAYVESL